MPKKLMIMKPDEDELNSDWLASARIMGKARKGDKKAQRKLTKRESTKMFTLTKSEEEEIKELLK